LDYNTKYLGVCFKSGRSLLIDNKLHAAASSIYNHVKYAFEMMVLFLQETFLFTVKSVSCCLLFSALLVVQWFSSEDIIIIIIKFLH